MQSKRFIKIVVIGFLFVVAFVGGVNYVVDPYGLNNFITIDKINSKKYSNTSMTTRFKANILQDGKFNAIMLGTSRIGVMNPEIIDLYLSTNTFNLEFPGSNTEIQNKFFKYANNFNDIKYVIYGIDFMAFNKNRIIKNDFKEFYDLEEKITNFEEILNFDLYFNFETFLKSNKLVIKNILNKQKIEPIYLSKNGMRDYVNYIEENQNANLTLDKNIESSINSYFMPNGMYKDYQFSYEYLDYFKEIIQICKEKDIKIYVYIPPMYSEHFDAINSAGYFDEFEKFKRELVEIIDYIDLTGHNIISIDKQNYWDSSHLRVETTELIMNNVIKSSSIKDNFLVTKQNIDKHLENLRNQIQNYDLNKTLHK